MKAYIKVLIIDDHPLIIDSYKSALHFLSAKNDQLDFKIEIASDCDSAIEKIVSQANNNKFDLIFLDIKLPPSKDGNILSGEDLGIKIKELLPKVKIIVSTTYNDNYRLYGIFTSINPDGFLIKNDVSAKQLVSAIKVVILDPPYYSKTVIQMLRKQLSNEFVLDRVDRKILYELSIGTKMKDLPTTLPLSIAGIEKRKRHLKEIFDVVKKDDRELLKKAKDSGFI